MYCKNCGQPNRDEAKFCRYCGTPLTTLEMKSGPAAEPAPAQPQSVPGASQAQPSSAGAAPQAAAAVNAQQPCVVNVYNGMPKQVPDAYRPISMWGYFGYNILFMIPVIGWIFNIIFALGGTSNVNLKYYARSKFCLTVLALIAVLVSCLTMAVPM